MGILSTIGKVFDLVLLIGPSIMQRIAQNAQAQSDFYNNVSAGIQGADDLVRLGDGLAAADQAVTDEYKKRGITFP